ncbi:hypothetical protein SK128_025255, partial [Halocaridina rubra]
MGKIAKKDDDSVAIQSVAQWIQCLAPILEDPRSSLYGSSHCFSSPAPRKSKEK